MAEFTQVTTNDLWVDGQSITISVQIVSNTLVVSWVPPVNPSAYDGAVVVLGTAPQTTQEQPIDGTRYQASSNWGTPASTNGTIGSSQVIAAYYGYFGDSITTNTSVTVTNIDPTQLYYATIYACSNVLQYYSVGCHSYPIASNSADINLAPYAGSIPTAFSPPTNPTPGQAYFDPATNTVYIYDGTQQAWARSNQQTVRIGEEPPIQAYQLFYVTPSNLLQFFDGSVWQTATSANLQVRMGASWAPFQSVAQAGGFPPTAPATGTFLFVTEPAAQLSAPPISSLWFCSLGKWFMPTPDMVQVNIAGTWVSITDPGINSFYGSAAPSIPNTGDMFYLTTTKRLLAWNGTSWTAIDTVERGQPTTSKVGIGSSGSSAARLELKDTLMTTLGYPNVCVELKPNHFDYAINRALAMFRRLADNAYTPRFISFTVYGDGGGGQSTYYLNDPRDKTDKIVSVIKIHRINQLGIASLSAETGLYAQAFYNQLYQGSNVDILSIHLMNQLSKVYSKIFAGDLVFTWDEASRELTILRRFLQAEERVVLEVLMEREEDELINDRWCGTWIQDWAHAELLYILGQERSKYGTLPGAQGGLTLNGDTLLSMSTDMKNELRRQITDYEVGNGGVVVQNGGIYEG